MCDPCTIIIVIDGCEPSNVDRTKRSDARDDTHYQNASVVLPRGPLEGALFKKTKEKVSWKKSVSV